MCKESHSLGQYVGAIQRSSHTELQKCISAKTTCVLYCHQLVITKRQPLQFSVQSDLGYPATKGPAHIQISDLADMRDMHKHRKFSRVKYIL